MSDPILIVPIGVNALAVNASVVSNQPFRRWPQTYITLSEFGSSEPSPSSIEPGIPVSQGVYLHWSLPDALKHGIQDPVTREIRFPKTPNRWLILRQSASGDKRSLRAFVIESDAPGDEESSNYMFDAATIAAWKLSKDPARRNAADKLNPAEGEAVCGLLGQSYNLEQWTEKGIEELFVTAVSPGNALFSAYQPHCQKVFSFRDKLEDLAGASQLSYTVIGWYSNNAEDPVVKCRMELSGGITPQEAYASWLAANGWKVQETGDGILPAGSLYQGVVLSLEWNPDAEIPTIKEHYQNDDGNNIHISVGNTSIDAFIALVQQQLEDSARDGEADAKQILGGLSNAADLLEAFQYDLLHVADQPDGWNQLDHRIRQEWFGSKAGGYRWIIVDSDDAPAQALSPAAIEVRRQQESWLADLNNVQAAYDQTLNELYSEQWQLYAIWWKQGKYNSYPSFSKPGGVTPEQFAKALAPKDDASYNPTEPPGPSNIYSIPARVAKLMNKLNKELAPKLPLPVYSSGKSTPEEALAAGIASFEDAKRKQGMLSAGRRLKAIPHARYWSANDPVVLIRGAGSTARIPDKEDRLACRYTGQTVQGVIAGSTKVTAADLASELPVLPLSRDTLAASIQGDYISAGTAAALTDTLNALTVEWFFLDPMNAPVMAVQQPEITPQLVASHNPEHFQGTLPAILPGVWSRPWNPFMLKWVVNWYPIPYGVSDGGTPNWRFDGTDYRFTGTAGHADFQTIGGDVLLTPQTSYLFRNRIAKLAATQSDADSKLLDELDSYIEQIDKWDFISQKLSGFAEQLSLRDIRTQLAPDQNLTFQFADGSKASLSDLVGDQVRQLPYLHSSGDSADFQATRQGQFYFSYLAVYDAFGQILDIIGDSGLSSSDKFTPIVAEGMKPDHPIEDVNPAKFVQLPPRLIQYSRLHFNFMDAAIPDLSLDIDPEINPIAGWLLANHLDRSISLYDGQGKSIGELVKVVGQGGKEQLILRFSIRGDYASISDVEKKAPELAKVASSLLTKDTRAFDQLLAVIDKALWMVDPPGSAQSRNLSILTGRPLALARAEIRLELDGFPLADPGWRATFNPPAPTFTQNDYEIRLGDPDIRQDGLIGYYANGDYDVFHCVDTAEAQEEQESYLQPIGPGGFLKLRFDGQTAISLLMLMDPWSVVHAVSGLLPVQTLQLPSGLVDSCLSRLSIQFFTGPLITEIGLSPVSSSGDDSPKFSMTMPVPIEKGGQWRWLEKAAPSSGTPVQTFGLSSSQEKAELSSSPKSLREGVLQFRLGDESDQ
ncbi:hypothetical protein [Paenibacillus caui]|uniref:hypothetical protein n=1 Tax=Paenibacillus caui TaxID=2873927 RepID=UPI001CA90894|nr:hypothetical protein [Paenibacillus caui]